MLGLGVQHSGGVVEKAVSEPAGVRPYLRLDT